MVMCNQSIARSLLPQPGRDRQGARARVDCVSVYSLSRSLWRIAMSDLDEAKRLLEKIVDANETGNTDVPNVTLALEILLKDYIQRASWAQGDLEKLTSKST